MIPLFKKRTFSDFLSDSFSFFKQEGKHFLKNYFVINGIFLMILIVLFYFMFKVYFEALTSNLNSVNPSFNFIEDYFLSNIGLVIGAIASFFFLIIFLTLLNFAFPIAYLKLYEKNKGVKFSTSEIIAEMKSKIGKILLFFLLSFLIIIPLVFILMAVLVMLSFILIGIPLLIISIPTLSSLMILSLYEYLNSNKGFFGSIQIAIGYLKKQFWPIVGSTMIMYMIVQVVLSLISMIPYIIGLISLFSDIENQNEGNALASLGILMSFVFVISILANYILNNLLIVNQGMIYYSSREYLENNSSLSDIESIGNNFE